jgi:hypothetical protein
MNKAGSIRSIKLTGLVIAGAVLAFVLLVGALEFHVRNWNLVTIYVDRGYVNFASGVEMAEPAKPLPSQLQVHLPEPKYESRRFDFPVPMAVQYPEDYFIDDSYFGIFIKSNYSGKFTQRFYDGQLAYDVEYRINGRGRRITHGELDSERVRPFYFLGCSYVFGEGVGQLDTLPSQAAQMHGDFQFYNYGMHGWGPGNVLRSIRHESFAADVGRKKGGIAVYVFMDHHMNRALGTFDIYQRGHLWEGRLPYYRLKGPGEVEDKGMMDSGRPLRNFLYRYLSKLLVIQYFDLARFYRYDQEDVDTVAAILSAIREGVQNKAQADFYVVFYPGTRSARALIPALDKLGVRTIDYSTVDLSRYTEHSPRLPDGNPSAGAHKFLAYQILRDLELTGER